MAYHLDIHLESRTARLITPPLIVLDWFEYAGIIYDRKSTPEHGVSFMLRLPSIYTETRAEMIAARIRTYGASVTILHFKQ